jgi:hypothetical protein
MAGLVLVGILTSGDVIASEPGEIAADTSSAATGPDQAHRKMHFLCNWVVGRVPSDVQLSPCDPSKVQAAGGAELEASMAGFWQDWAVISPRTTASVRNRFEADYLRSLPPHRYSAAELQALPVDKLCTMVRGRTSADGAIAELTRRGSFTTMEMGYIRSRTIQIGISEGAMRCSWGAADRRNRMILPGTVDAQWVYGDTLVYTTNGIVTALQD